MLKCVNLTKNAPYHHRRKTLTFGFILNRDASKQIRPCTGSHAPAPNIFIKLILNGKCGVINSDPILALQRFFESDLNNGPSPSHPNLVSDGIFIHLFRSPTYGFLVGAISAQGLQA